MESCSLGHLRLMATEHERIEELEQELVFLMDEVERYRSAAEDTLQQLDWCIGYFTGSKRSDIARVLNANRGQIRTKYLRRASESQPVEAGASASD